jgi:hypothetical protein
MGYSQYGSHYASVGKLLNCLVACIIMSTIAFAALPSFLMRNSKSTGAANTINANMHRTRFQTLKKNGSGKILYGSNPYLYKGSSAERKVVLTKYGRVAKPQLLRGKRVTSSAIDFDPRALRSSGYPYESRIKLKESVIQSKNRDKKAKGDET